MKYFILGGTGLIGGHLVPFLLNQKSEVLALVRRGSEKKLPAGAVPVFGSGLEPGDWQKKAARCDVVINLLGKNIFCRWTREAKDKILETRTLSTRLAVQALSARETPGTFICANAVGYYGHRGDKEISESDPPGDDFLARVCIKWQQEALKAETFGHRVVIPRFAAVLAPDGGALNKMLPAFRLGAGGRLGSGKQWFPWVHIRDLVRALSFLARSPETFGPYNICSPEPATNSTFTRALTESLGRQALLPVPGFMLRLVFGDMGNMLLNSQKCRPQRLQGHGFSFHYPGLKTALEDLLSS
ncbi:MAG: TIGR01777 family oxidoreductase [Desulfonatronovibrionaceae bacterium]